MVTVLLAGIVVAGNLTAIRQDSPAPPHATASPESPQPSTSDGVLSGGGLGGGTDGGIGGGTSGSDGKTGTEGGRTGDHDGVLPLLSADNLGALGSVIGGVAGAVAACVSVYQFRANRSASLLATPAAEPPPAEPPPNDLVHGWR
jgi:hypothetical protein